jgi:hypothetical protein
MSAATSHARADGVTRRDGHPPGTACESRGHRLCLEARAGRPRVQLVSRASSDHLVVAADAGTARLPAGHDMGLVGSYLCALWGSSQGFYASPIEFIKNPMIWMTGMSKFQASFSQGPNFAWALAGECCAHAPHVRHSSRPRS